MIKLFEQYNKYRESLDTFKTKLLYHIMGGNIVDSIDNIIIFQDFFNNDIPEELKYEGKLYRLLQTNSKVIYDRLLKKGFIVFPNQKYYSCSKTLEGIEKVKEKTSKKRYKYYVLFEIDVTKDDVLFDINKVIEYLNIGEKRYMDEEEVLVLSDRINKVGKEGIISHGKY